MADKEWAKKIDDRKKKILDKAELNMEDLDKVSGGDGDVYDPDGSGGMNTVGPNVHRERH